MTMPLGFELEPLMLAVGKLLPTRRVPENLAQSPKYRQIRSSIEEVDLIEPLSVTSYDPVARSHHILDGHIRLIALKDLKRQEVPCLVALDDEAYTYNNRINRISAVQEHYMIRRALDRGVPPERLAKALCVHEKHIRAKSTLLDGICSEAIEILSDRQFSVEVSTTLKKMRPMRQLECVELMSSANNFTLSYARALLLASPEQTLVEEKKKPKAMSREQLSKMEREMSSIQDQYKMAEETYGEDVLNLVLAKGYISKLVANDAIVRYLHTNHAEILEQFSRIIDS